MEEIRKRALWGLFFRSSRWAFCVLFDPLIDFGLALDLGGSFHLMIQLLFDLADAVGPLVISAGCHRSGDTSCSMCWCREWGVGLQALRYVRTGANMHRKNSMALFSGSS